MLFKDYNYDDYWRSIMRAVRYLTEMRLAAKILELYTLNVLEKIAEGAPGSYIIRQASNSARALARARFMSTPTTIGSADSAIIKYDRLRHVLGIREILANVEANINLIVNLSAATSQATGASGVEAINNLTVNLSSATGQATGASG